MAEDEEISPGGSRIFRHEELGAEPEPAAGDVELLDAVTAHVERHVGPVEDVLHELVSPFVHLDLLHVEPSEQSPWHTLVTCGMSARPMRAPEPALAFAELTLALPPDWEMDSSRWDDERHYLRFPNWGCSGLIVEVGGGIAAVLAAFGVPPGPEVVVFRCTLWSFC